MRALFFQLFSDSHFDTGILVTPLSLAHIVYLILIFGGLVTVYLHFRKKDAKTKEKVLRFFAYALVISYLSDFFVHEFVYEGLNIDKLPFHICTFLCPLVAIAQFNGRGHKIAEPVAMLSILSSLLYICIPLSIGDAEPWCYRAVQTMFYHSMLLGWGILSLAFGVVKPNIRRIWQSAVLLGIATLWAKLGCILMQHNWFFLEEDVLYLGLVEDGIIPKWSLMVINPIVCFLAVLLTYGICYLIRRVKRNK